ncbi:MAG: alanine racemase [Clostridia bacterium]|nr:alanine racemase [Clostridia bacterium]
MQNRSELVIDVPRIVKNYTIFNDSLKSGQKLMAVIKANAYGHGDVQVAKALEKVGCTDFCVATIEEAINLRNHGIKGTILILGYTPASYAKTLVDLNIHQAVVSEEHLRDLLNTGLKIPVQFKIDTGMHRIGFAPDGNTENAIRQAQKNLCVKGIFTHLCVADDPARNEFTCGQIETFKAFTKRIEDLKLPYIHCCNSAGIMYHNDGFSTHLRLGISLYGLKPDYCNTLLEGVLPALEWKAQIAMVKTLKKGDGLGYGLTFTADKDMKIATVTIGYADGYPRRLSNLGTVYIGGKKAKIVGRVCMDQMMIDVTDIDVKMGDVALLLCDQYTADDMANDIGTIGYEIVTQITQRVTKTFKEN